MFGRRFSSSDSCVLLWFAATAGLVSLPPPSRAFLLPFVPSHPIRSVVPQRIRARGTWGRSCFETATTRTVLEATTSSSLPEVSSMRAGDIRKELESYGISTKSFLEKKELVEALEKARREGRTPVEDPQLSDTEVASPSASTSNSTSTSTSASTSNSTSTGDDSKSRDERIASEVEKCKSMKVSELRKELKELGISTRSFFEKSEFVKALAEARVDGVKRKAKGEGGSEQQEEDYDPEYKDVVMKKFEAGKDPRMRLTGDVIDITI